MRQERDSSADLELSILSQILVLAKDEARRLGHHFMRSEHLLLALLREGTVNQFLEERGINVELVLSSLESFTSGGQKPTTNKIPLAPVTEKIVRFTKREIHRHQSPQDTPWYLLRGIFNSGNAAINGLRSLGYNRQIQEIRKALNTR